LNLRFLDITDSRFYLPFQKHPGVHEFVSAKFIQGKNVIVEISETEAVSNIMKFFLYNNILVHKIIMRLLGTYCSFYFVAMKQRVDVYALLKDNTGFCQRKKSRAFIKVS
jgi:hypothetical protein